ncbi:tellurite resistance TerB family protein [Sneathiella aquimaris]|uniref:tellurite resistance TerB family protein n=1 Tax=Sneathiella aquimaris TaxID=2599305 RepID=UPI00146F141E|nr:TerB family tellurite resistance protein [Sneathiella aquimaris]
MIAKLKAIFAGDETSLQNSPDDKQTATAALLIEAALADEDFSDSEENAISRLLKRHFSLSGDEAEALIDEARELHKNSDQILYFTRAIKENFPVDDRIQIIEMLWEIAYADGTVSDYEANLIRRICGLIYVDDRESGLAKKRVMQTLGITS